MKGKDGQNDQVTLLPKRNIRKAAELKKNMSKDFSFFFNLNVGSPFSKKSSAVVRSHIWMAPHVCPVKINLKNNVIEN